MKNHNKLEIAVKGQLLIPKLYRLKNGIRPGSRVALAAEKNKLTVYVIPDDPIEASCGVLKGAPSLAAKLMVERRAELEKEKKNLGR